MLLIDVTRRFRWCDYPAWAVWLIHVLALLPGVALIISFLITPGRVESGEISILPGCLFRAVFDRPCLGCGMTRAFCSISHGDIAAAIDYNWLSLICYPAFVILSLFGMISLISYLRRVPDRDGCRAS